MAQGRLLVIGKREFRTQKAAIEFFRAMREGYETYGRLQGTDAEDVAALLLRHPDNHQKVGVGVAHFIAALQRGPNYVSNCFAVVRIDGTRENFSYITCVTQRRRNR